MGAQAANIGVAQQVISYDWTDKPLSHQAYGIDAIAIAPYIGYYLARQKMPPKSPVGLATRMEDAKNFLTKSPKEES